MWSFHENKTLPTLIRGNTEGKHEFSSPPAAPTGLQRETPVPLKVQRGESNLPTPEGGGEERWGCSTPINPEEAAQHKPLKEETLPMVSTASVPSLF